MCRKDTVQKIHKFKSSIDRKWFTLDFIDNSTGTEEQRDGGRSDREKVAGINKGMREASAEGGKSGFKSFALN